MSNAIHNKDLFHEYHGVDVSQFQINFLFVFQDNHGIHGTVKVWQSIKTVCNAFTIHAVNYVENILLYREIMYIRNLQYHIINNS